MLMRYFSAVFLLTISVAGMAALPAAKSLDTATTYRCTDKSGHVVFSSAHAVMQKCKGTPPHTVRGGKCEAWSLRAAKYWGR